MHKPAHASVLTRAYEFVVRNSAFICGGDFYRFFRCRGFEKEDNVRLMHASMTKSINQLRKVFFHHLKIDEGKESYIWP